MFYSVDFPLKFTRMFCYILTWVCSVGSFLAGVILAILVHPICLLSAILTPPFCWLGWLFYDVLFTFFGDVKRIRNQLCKASVPAGSPSAKAAEGEKKAVFSLRETYDAIEHLRRMRNLRRAGVFSEDEYMKNAEKRLVLKEGYFLLSREDRLACLDDAVDQCEEIQELFSKGELSAAEYERKTGMLLKR